MATKKHHFQKRGDYVVVGKGIPRSVGLSAYMANEYSKYWKQKGMKPRILKVK